MKIAKLQIGRLDCGRLCLVAVTADGGEHFIPSAEIEQLDQTVYHHTHWTYGVMTPEITVNGATYKVTARWGEGTQQNTDSSGP